MDWIRIAGIIILGWGMGIIINYLGDVLPATRRFSHPVCLHCGQAVSMTDYVLLRNCKNCGKHRQIRAWVVQLSAILVVGSLGLLPSDRLGFWPGLIILGYFGVVALIDIEHRLIMHPVSLAGVLLGGAVGIWLHGWQRTLLGGLAGFAIMLGFYLLGFLFARWLARIRKLETDEEALGFGDVALSGVLGLLLGWPGIIAGLVLAILLGGAGSLIVLGYSLLSRKYHAYMAIPYGPFLLAAAVLLLFRIVGG